MDAWLRFHDHEGFQKIAASTVVLTAALAAIWALPAQGAHAWGWPVFFAPAIWLIEPRLGRRIARLGLLALGAIALLVSTDGARLAAWDGPALLAFLVLGGAAFAKPELSPGRSLALVAFASSALFAALWAGDRIFFAAELAHLDESLRGAITGVGVGCVSLLAVAARHVSLGPGKIQRAERAARAGTADDVLDLVQRGHGVWERVKRSFPEGDENRALLEDALTDLFTAAAQSAAHESVRDANRSAALRDRLASLGARANATDDPVAIEQYKHAEAAIEEQVRYMEDMEVIRQRRLARLENALATIERLYLAACRKETIDGQALAMQKGVG